MYFCFSNRRKTLEKAPCKGERDTKASRCILVRYGYGLVHIHIEHQAAKTPLKRFCPQKIFNGKEQPIISERLEIYCKALINCRVATQ